jgi:hypothetical protein
MHVLYTVNYNTEYAVYTQYDVNTLDKDQDRPAVSSGWTSHNDLYSYSQV